MGAEMEACWFLWDETDNSAQGQEAREVYQDLWRCAVSSFSFLMLTLCFRHLQVPYTIFLENKGCGLHTCDHDVVDCPEPIPDRIPQNKLENEGRCADRIR